MPKKVKKSVKQPFQIARNKECSNCGQHIEREWFASLEYRPPETVYIPHENLIDCIKHLTTELQQMKSDFEYHEKNYYHNETNKGYG